jgi:hypothetical protein
MPASPEFLVSAGISHFLTRQTVSPNLTLEQGSERELRSDDKMRRVIGRLTTLRVKQLMRERKPDRVSDGGNLFLQDGSAWSFDYERDGVRLHGTRASAYSRACQGPLAGR